MEKIEKKKNILIIFLVAAVIVSIDQISKWLISSHLSYTESKQIIKGFFSITNARNFGAAWSIFWNQRILLIVIPIIALIFVMHIAYKEKKLNLYKNIYYGLLIGGILGNLIDRIFLGYVIDFLDFTFFGFHYPIFVMYLLLSV